MLDIDIVVYVSTYVSTYKCISATDEEIKSRLAPYAALVHRAENVPVGSTSRTMRADDCVFGECTLGDMLVDAFAEFVRISAPFLSTPGHVYYKLSKYL